MESGDIIYLILLVFFMILGFFNDSRKKKQKRMEAQEQRETELPSFPVESGELDEEEEGMPRQPEWQMDKPLPPPMPAAHPAKDLYKNFQSSADLVSIHQDPSVLSSYTFDYDVDSFYEPDPDSPDAPANAREETSKKAIHPLISGLREATARDELKKGLVYGEIIQRKY